MGVRKDKGIPPDAYPVGQPGAFYARTTSFDRQMGGDHIRHAEIRGAAGTSVVSVSIAVIPPEGKPSIPLDSVRFGRVNNTQPQLTAVIQTTDGSPISDGYRCHFTFQGVIPASK